MGWFSLLLFVSTLWSVSFASAQSLCKEVTCNESQQQIQNAFDASPGFSRDAIGGVYSGVCFHVMPYFDPAQEHHALSLIEPNDTTGANFRAVLTFFATTNPYVGMSYDEAQKLLDARGSKHPEMELSPAGGYVIFRSTTGTIEYWLRTSGDTMFMLSAWNLQSGSMRTWCRLTRHR